MKKITTNDLKNLIEDKSKDFILIDVRTTEEWNSEHIKDSRVKNIEVNSLLSNPSVIYKDKDCYLICESGGRSAYAQMLLKLKGIETIEVKGGMSSYRKL
jgi:rhodanese-related sulfurtransferase